MTRKSAHFIGDDRAFCPQVDSHSEQCVNQADTVRAHIFTGFCDFRNIRHIRGKFQQHRLFCHFSDCLRDLCRCLRTGSERHAAAMHIRTADVDFVPSDLAARRFVGFEFFDCLRIVAYRKSADICHHRLMKNLCQRGKFLADNLFHARVLQSDRVNHAVRALRNPRRRVAEARLQGRAFERKGSQAVYIIKFVKFSSVAESATCRNHRIVKADSAKLGGNIRFRSACGFLFSIYHMISSLSKTGPSLQILLFPYFVLQEHPMQAPNPHPIRSSKLSCPEVFASVSIAFSMASGPQA